MHERGEPDPALDAGALPDGRATAPGRRVDTLSGKQFALFVIVTELKGAIEELSHIHSLANHLTGRSCLTFVNKVATPKLFRRQPNCARDFVHVALEREDALRRAETSERAMRRNVSGDSATVYTHVRTRVWTGGVDGAA